MAAQKLERVCWEMYVGDHSPSTDFQELIQQDVLPSKDNPSTSCACMIFSGPANTHAQVTMCADVDDEYINQVFQKFPNADNALETKLKNVRLNSRVNVEDIKTCMSSFCAELLIFRR